LLLLKHETELKKAIALKFKIKDMGELKSILGITIERISVCWLIHQINFVDEITTMFNVNNVKAQLIPLQPNLGHNLEFSEEAEV